MEPVTKKELDNAVIAIKRKSLIIKTSAINYNYNYFCDAIEDFRGLRNISSTEDFDIARGAIDRLFHDLEGNNYEV